MPKCKSTNAILSVGLTLLLALAVACGPASPQAQSDGEAGPFAQADGDAPATPKPTPPVPEDGSGKTDDPPKPTRVPPPTEKPPEEPLPVPTRAAGDPESPTPSPTEPIPPSEDPVTQDIPVQPHPDGHLEGCRTLSPFSASYEQIRATAWCMEELGADVQQHCRGTGTSQEEKACAVSRLANVRSYFMREMGPACMAISDQNAQAQCQEDFWLASITHQESLLTIWNVILDAVSTNPEVKVHYSAMVRCVREQGYEPPRYAGRLTWQEIDKDRIPEKPQRSKTERVSHRERLRVINQCALDTKLYDTQDEKWQAEIRGRFNADPAPLRPLKEEGILAILEEPGPARFLIIHTFNIEE